MLKQLFNHFIQIKMTISLFFIFCMKATIHRLMLKILTNLMYGFLIWFFPQAIELYQ